MSSSESLTSAIYHGQVRHRRFTPASHQFDYKMYMLALDVDEIPRLEQHSLWFGKKWYKPLRFCQKDYLKNEPGSLKDRIINKIVSLGGVIPSTSDQKQNISIIMLCQCRCFGIYFNPVNFYFCYSDDNCLYMLAEVSNTPWNERHYYLIDMKLFGNDQESPVTSDKAFHVSPFMDLAMAYHWRIKPPTKKLLVHIENHKNTGSETKIFDATLALKKRELNKINIVKTLINFPVMTVKIFGAIYWQALKLFIKKVPFVSHPKHMS